VTLETLTQKTATSEIGNHKALSLMSRQRSAIVVPDCRVWSWDGGRKKSFSSLLFWIAPDVEAEARQAGRQCREERSTELDDFLV